MAEKQDLAAQGQAPQDKLEASMKIIRYVESWLQGMYEEVEGGGHVHVIESRLRDVLFNLRHAIEQIEEYQKEKK